jgi:quinoprotein glucose dehydrogenase
MRRSRRIYNTMDLNLAPRDSPLSPRLFAAVLLLLGGAFVAGGLSLLRVGGSPYYLIAGLTVVASAVLSWRRSPGAPRMYALMLLGTLIWSLWEVGFDAWALMPRLLMLSIIGAWFATPWMRTGLQRGHSLRKHSSHARFAAIAACLCAAISFAVVALSWGPYVSASKEIAVTSP